MSNCSVILFMAKFPDNAIVTETVKFTKYDYAGVVNTCMASMKKFYKEPINTTFTKATMETVAAACKDKYPVFICVTRLDGKILLHSYKTEYLDRSMLDSKGEVLADKLANQLRVFHISRNPLNNPFMWD